MKRLFALIGLLLQGGGQPINVPIQNPSFEQVSAPLPASTPCGKWGWDGQGYDGIPNWSPDSFHITGWQFSSKTEVFQPNNPKTCDYIAPPHDGSTVAYAGYGGSFSQDTGVKASSVQAGPVDGIYTLKFFVANYFAVYPGYYEADISIGTQELCSTDGWATQYFTEVTLVCPAPRYIVFNNEFGFNSSANLVISFSAATGWPLLFDDVSLTFTPN